MSSRTVEQLAAVPVTLDSWSSDIDAFISVTLEDFDAARLFVFDSEDLDGE